MRYQEINSDRRKKQSPLRNVLVFGFLLMLLIVGETNLHTWLGPSVAGFFSPVASVLQSVTPRFNLFTSKTDLEHENDRLRNELASLSNAALSFKTLEDENTKLKALLGRHATSTVLLAGVISRPPESPYDTLVVDAGSKLGVSIGAGVWSASSVRIGSIESVSPNNARVRLYTAPGNKLHILLGASSTPIEIEGQGGNSFKGSLPSSVNVATGTPAYLPGIKKELVGVVRNVQEENQQTFQDIFIANITETSDLDFVLIEKNTEKQNTATTTGK